MSAKKKAQGEMFDEDETPAETPATAAPAPVAAAPKGKGYKVLEEKVVSIGGCMTTIRKGQVLDPDGYSAATIASLNVQGVKLEEV